MIRRLKISIMKKHKCIYRSHKLWSAAFFQKRDRALNLSMIDRMADRNNGEEIDKRMRLKIKRFHKMFTDLLKFYVSAYFFID